MSVQPPPHATPRREPQHLKRCRGPRIYRAVGRNELDSAPGTRRLGSSDSRRPRPDRRGTRPGRPSALPSSEPNTGRCRSRRHRQASGEPRRRHRGMAWPSRNDRRERPRRKDARPSRTTTEARWRQAAPCYFVTTLCFSSKIRALLRFSAVWMFACSAGPTSPSAPACASRAVTLDWPRSSPATSGWSE